MEGQNLNNINSRRNTRIKNKKKNRLKALILLIIFATVTMIIININSNSNTKKIIGTWTIDGITTYEFNDKKTGNLITSVSKYEFNYKLKNNKLYIDFKNEKIKDATFEIIIKNDKLSLTGVEETTGTYNLTKK